MDVTVIVGTYGDDHWRDLGAATAAAHEAIHVHGDTLAGARNTGAQAATTEWLVFLDADDSLSPGYCDAILAADGDLRAPALHLIYPDRVVVPDLAGRDMNRMNACPIGTGIRRQLLLECGGFWEEPAFEDYSLFRRAWLIGAVISHVPDAVYQAHVRARSRNNSVDDPGALVKSIQASHAMWLADWVPPTRGKWSRA